MKTKYAIISALIFISSSCLSKENKILHIVDNDIPVFLNDNNVIFINDYEIDSCMYPIYKDKEAYQIADAIIVNWNNMEELINKKNQLNEIIDEAWDELFLENRGNKSKIDSLEIIRDSVLDEYKILLEKRDSLDDLLKSRINEFGKQFAGYHVLRCVGLPSESGKRNYILEYFINPEIDSIYSKRILIPSQERKTPLDEICVTVSLLNTNNRYW